MPARRPIALTPGSLFFSPGLPIHVNRATESFELQEHAHEFIEVCAVAEGSGEHYIDGGHFKVSRGDVFYIPVGVSHVFRPLSASPGQRLVVYNCLFTRGALESILRLIPIEDELGAFFREMEDGRRWFAVRDPSCEAERILARLRDESARRAAGHAALLHAGMLELLVHLFRQSRNGRDGRPATAGASEAVRAWLARIDRSSAEPVRAERIAGELGISARQLQRWVRKETGMSLTEYAQNARIRESCRLLAESAMPVATVASAVGYQDMKFFNRLFKLKTGLTPGEYRRQAKIRPE
ncbi:helix-turn-helix domain-containing protein [Cohnella caldifontis]|uniref:helix-turn-helix domain-containing protein n=1 Tax=Cohnella caldifontis TaxID=3027471 RepID=UPI0023EBB1B6|nr:helix-turn-helix domain-containing protein [Cohnella sp. YIM B05605]